MKTQIITILTALTLVAGVANASNTVAAKNQDYTVLAGVNGINKIEVRGNVQLYISDGASDDVKVYNHYYAESALVKNRNGVLSIASYKAEKLVVWVTAADLRSVSAYDNAEVKSFGTLSKIEFDVNLYNNASAKLNLDAVNANVAVNDNAKADLAGTANQYKLVHSLTSRVNNNSFSAVNYSETKTGMPVMTEEDELAGL